MFGNFLGFRDLTLYVIPGNVTLFLIYNILIQLNFNIFEFLHQEFSDNIFIFITVALGGFLGFLQNQLLIVEVNKIIKKSKKYPIDLEKIGLNKEMKILFVKTFNNVFGLKIDNKINDSIIQFCNQYVLLNTNEHSYGYTRRIMNYSLFSISIIIPINLLIILFSISIFENYYFLIILTLLFLILINYFLFHVTLRLRIVWIKNIINYFITTEINKKNIASANKVLPKAGLKFFG